MPIGLPDEVVELLDAVRACMPLAGSDDYQTLSVIVSELRFDGDTPYACRLAEQLAGRHTGEDWRRVVTAVDALRAARARATHPPQEP